MKNTPYLLINLVLGVFLLLPACAPSKKMQATKARIAQLEQDSSTRELAARGRAAQREQDSSARELAARARIAQLERDSSARKLAASKAGEMNRPDVPAKQKTTPVPSVRTEDENVSLPPVRVASVFATSYPAASKVWWTRKAPHTQLVDKATGHYKADFLVAANTNSVIYDENGKLVESREEILPVQLPPNILEAIKKKYPNTFVLSASTFKSTQMEGSYAAILRSTAQSDDIEVVMTETGEFIK